MTEEDGKQPIEITKDELGQAKDWLTTHLEAKGKPVWEREINIDGRIIKLINYNPEFEFTEVHEQELVTFVRTANNQCPKILETFRRLIFDDYQPSSRYGDEANYPFNGTRLDDGVLLYPNGQRTDLRHRTNVASNYQATIAHERLHTIGAEHERLWKESFGWHYCSEFPDNWEQVKEQPRRYRRKDGRFIALEGQFTEHPENCVSDYAKMAWDDDFADAGIVALINPEKLTSIAPQKLDYFKANIFQK
jgi:hypothetical protein